MAKSRFNRKYNVSLRKRSNDDAKSIAEFIKASEHFNQGFYLSLPSLISKDRGILFFTGSLFISPSLF